MTRITEKKIKLNIESEDGRGEGEIPTESRRNERKRIPKSRTLPRLVTIPPSSLPPSRFGVDVLEIREIGEQSAMGRAVHWRRNRILSTIVAAVSPPFLPLILPSSHHGAETAWFV